MTKNIVLAFLAVYFIWGSTYLAIGLAVATITPWLLVSARFLVAGACMLIVSHVVKERPLSREEKKIAFASGPLLVLANGVVGIAETKVSSGLASVVVATMPMWIMLLGFKIFHLPKPTFKKMTGALCGVLGIGVIASEGFLQPNGFDERLGVLLLLFSSLSWAMGSLLQTRISQLSSPLRYSAYQMQSGSALTLILCLTFEHPLAVLPSISITSWLALVYLIVFGSIIAFNCYVWLSRNVEPNLVSTYALVNPLIAVLLGVTLNHERVGRIFLVGSVLVLIGVALIVIKPRQVPKRAAI